VIIDGLRRLECRGYDSAGIAVAGNGVSTSRVPLPPYSRSSLDHIWPNSSLLATTIRELAETISEVLEFKGRLTFDVTKPDGTPRKVLDVTRMHELGWTAKTDLRTGLRRAYADFKAHHLQYALA
jgi:hypothetical protein